MAVTYAQATDVQRIIQGPTFSGSTTPTTTQVEAFINAAEDQIDRDTRRAWRSVTVTDEYYNIPKVHNVGHHQGHGHRRFIKIYLRHRHVKTFAGVSGDKLEIWDGSSDVDWIATKTEGRADDFWVNYTDGILYVRMQHALYHEDGAKLTYRYGETTVPSDIKDATAMLAAVMVLGSDDNSQVVAETGDATRQSHQSRIEQWSTRAREIIEANADPIIL